MSSPATGPERDAQAQRAARTIADIEGTLVPRLVRRATRQAEHAGYWLGEIESDGMRSDLERVAVETDFYDYHRGSIIFQNDHRRGLDLRRHGFAVRRFSEQQLNERPAEVAADLRDALGLAS